MRSRVQVAALGEGWAGPSNSHLPPGAFPDCGNAADGLAGGGQISVSSWLPEGENSAKSPVGLARTGRPCPEPQLDPSAPGALTAHRVCVLFPGASYCQRDHAMRCLCRIFPESLLPRVHAGAGLILASPGWEWGGARWEPSPWRLGPEKVDESSQPSAQKGSVTQAEQTLSPMASWRFVPTAPGLSLLTLRYRCTLILQSADHLSGWDSTGHAAGTQRIFAQRFCSCIWFFFFKIIHTL